jgi:hypothetical protein
LGPMKQTDFLAGGHTLFSLWTGRFAAATVLTALALIAAPVAKADVLETFTLSGTFGSFFGPPAAFTGTIKLDFSNDFTEDTLQSMAITVNGRPVFNKSPSLRLAMSASKGIISESNSSGDVLTLMFATPTPGAWAGFNQGTIAGGQVIFSGLTGLYLGANGVITRDLSGPPIVAPPILDPPPIIEPPPLSDPPPITSGAVPELSTWAMMLLGLAGLGLAAKRRRTIGFLGGKA